MGRDPESYPNLRGNPHTPAHLRGAGPRRVRGRTAEPAERAALWPRLVDL